jgi:hypothetical protein
LKDRQKIILETVESSQIIKNKWALKKRELDNLREEEIRK